MKRSQQSTTSAARAASGPMDMQGERGSIAPDESVRGAGNFLVFGSPQIEEAEIEEVVAAMRSCWLGTGPRVAAFEDAFRDYRGAEHATAVSSCTAALHLSLLALGIGPGDEVITTPLTFCATVNAILYTGATPVLADVDPETFNLTPSTIEGALTQRTRAIVPVHFAGRPCDMTAIMGIAGRNGLLVVEDCAHAIEASYLGQSMGTFGDAGCFSFYATKNLTTGEGGMVITGHEEVADSLKVLALHGMSRDAWRRFSDTGFRHYVVETLGYKYNMTDMQAAIGIHQLRRIEENWVRRREVWEMYKAALADLPLQLPAEVEQGTRHAFHLFTILVDSDAVGLGRDDFLDQMSRHGIGTGVHYLSLTEHPYYQERLGWSAETSPTASRIGRQTVSLPISAKLTDSDVEDVVEAVRRTLESGRPHP